MCLSYSRAVVGPEESTEDECTAGVSALSEVEDVDEVEEGSSAGTEVATVSGAIGIGPLVSVR